MQLFNLIDVDKTGKIGYRELRSLAEELGEPLTAAEIEEMIHRADINGDGYVDSVSIFKYASIKRLFLRVVEFRRRVCLYLRFAAGRVLPDNHISTVTVEG